MGKSVIAKFNKNFPVKDLISRSKKRASERALDDVVPLTDNIPASLQNFLSQTLAKLNEFTMKQAYETAKGLFRVVRGAVRRIPGRFLTLNPEPPKMRTPVTTP